MTTQTSLKELSIADLKALIDFLETPKFRPIESDYKIGTKYDRLSELVYEEICTRINNIKEFNNG